ncbi:MAG: hypothetical protein A3J58_03135 [Candidatus Sungbacteria bacterium RIFCSPHIGHO2_02_FULL_52_23]|uniref:Ig-like domain-containing protein n=1 Tax=Candidatus Sungbacteria bacterium RIFCSPHIGHO2_02_FULL_52_23 TaxID=1802274 RepID=A0A1G2KT15_9BACT|nr:MAG: hypothetical protein A3J58_03135 [Candidatus Sungbacteria bacterium RIFCSPHIGHO2_02_FULL_52_23]
MNRLRHKKIWQVLSILACAGILLAIAPHAVHAQGYVAKKGIEILGTVFAIYGILVVLQSLLTIGLGLAGGFLSFAFALNTAVNPGQLIVVQQGWLILRDLANGLFILLLLWIAITIIFNLDQLGGKRFLVKIIMVALLINFSLALVSTVFALGNTLAAPFAQKMGLYPDCTATTCTPAKTGIAELIIANSQIHEVTKAITTQGADTLWKAGLPSPTAPQPREDIPTSLRNNLGAPPTAHAVAFLAPLLGILMKPIVMSVVVNIAGALATTLVAVGIHASGLDASVLNGIFNMAIASGFLLLTSLAMLSAAIILLLRVVAMVFIGVFAPIAFLGIAFPKFGDQIWSRWIRELFNWAFTAPIFYFLLYLALMMMQTNRSGNEALFASMSFTANFFKMLNLVLFLVFLWAAVYMTRKTAGHFADVALNLGRKAAGFGLGVATGFAARGIGRAALRGAPYIEKTMGAIGRTPLALALGRRTEKYIQAERERSKKREDQFKNGSEQYLAAQLRSSTSAEDIAAIGRVAANENKMGALKGREGDVVKLATRLGLQKDILKKLPHFATEKNVPGAKNDADAIAKMLKELPDKSGINADFLTGPNAVPNSNLVLRELWKNASRSDLGAIGQKNRKLQGAMTDYIESIQADPTDPANVGLSPDQLKIKGLREFKEELGESKLRELESYFRGSLAGDASQGGWRTTNWDSVHTPLKVPASHTGSVPSGTQYPRSLSVSGGSGHYTWKLTTGALPPSLILTSSGSFSGTITAPPGSYTCTAEVNDGYTTATVPITLTIT